MFVFQNILQLFSVVFIQSNLCVTFVTHQKDIVALSICAHDNQGFVMRCS